MRDWYNELSPDLAPRCAARRTNVFALVISVRAQLYPGPWTQLYLLVLTCVDELLDLDIESNEFYWQWFRC